MNRYLTFLFAMFAVIARGQEVNYQFKHLSTGDGLSQSSVIAIEQDRLGQMWLGTRDGLNRYDGNVFTVYRNDPNDSTSISNSDILSIEEDTEGYLWIGTYNGLNRFDPVEDTFQRFFHSPTTNSITGNTVRCVSEMDDGTIWAGTSDGLSVYDKVTQRFSLITPSENSYSGLPFEYITSLEQTDNGTIWVGTENGLCKVEKQMTDNYIVTAFNPPHLENRFFIQDLVSCGKQTLCIATKNQGMLRFDTTTETFLPEYRDTRLVETDTDVRALNQTADGKLWLGTSNGLTLLRDDGGGQKLLNRPDNPKSLSHDYVKSLFTDKKGSLWIGTYYGGVNIWDDSNSNFINYSQNSSKRGLGHKVVSSIVEDNAGNLYFGTEGKGITIHPKNADTDQYIDREGYPELLSDNVKSLLVRKDNLWIGSYDEGAYVFDLKTRKFDTNTINKELGKYLKKTGVYSIQSEKEDAVWLGTFGKGLVRYDIASQKMDIFSTGTSGNGALTNARVRSILIDSKGQVWAGTQSGLNVLRHKNGSPTDRDIQHFFYEEGKKSGDDILALFESSLGTIWVGVRAKGLFRYTGKSFEPVHITSGEPLGSVYAILEDAHQKLWISSNQGIIKYDPASDTSTRYGQKDGLAGNEFNSGAALKIEGSKMYFGGPSGVSYFDSDRLSMNTYVPQVLLTDFKISNESVSPADEQSILQKHITYTQNVTLAHDMANFSIDFAIPNFINPSSNRYSYRMVGLEKDWNLTDQTRANYTVQNAGDYIFEVRGANNDGIWNSEPTRLYIRVEPTPWRSTWAFILYAALILVALVGLIWIIKSKSRLKHQLDLEQLEREQTQNINQAKLRFFTNISHEFRTPLTLIAGPLQKLLNEYRGSSILYKKLLVMESNANHLLRLINRLMDFRKLENHQFKLEAAEGNIVKFLREIYLSFTEFAKDGEYDYTFSTSDETMLVYYDRRKLESVFYNLISNAFKNTPKKGSVAIRMQKEEGRILIDVDDSGIGIPEQYRSNIFDRFFEIDSALGDDGRPGTGIGLSIAKNIVDLHHGEIEVKSKCSPGSLFRVCLLLGREHLEATEILEDFKFSDDLAQYTSQLKRPLWEIKLPNYSMQDAEKETVLVVEDNHALRAFIADLLKTKYNILEAGDGREGWKQTVKHLPDLVISDVIMPEMVGTELCAQIKSNLKTSHIPVILLTSRTSLVYKFEGLESGADDYISKPFNLKEFQLRIKNLIDATGRLKKKFSDSLPLAAKEMTLSTLDEKLLQKALNIVETNISNDKFDIPTFSQHLGISRTLMFTKIKAWTNLTPNEFIQEMRMKRALQLLEQSHFNISQIAYQVGFNNPKYFSKCFQKRFGETPSRYQSQFFHDVADLN